jgi:hypothetical protein
MNDKIILLIASAMSREEGVNIYVDILKKDIVGYVNGYISSYLGDESTNNRILAERIMSDTPNDYLDLERYIEIPRITAQQFLNEFINNANGNIPFDDFAKNFKQNIGAIFNDLSITANDVFWGDFIEENFHEQFSSLYGDKMQELAESYKMLFETSIINLANRWFIEITNSTSLNVDSIYYMRNLNPDDLGTLYIGLSKELFPKPIKGKLLFKEESDYSCTLFFEKNYYNELLQSIDKAFANGKFSESNQETSWNNLRYEIYQAQPDNETNVNELKTYLIYK